MLANLPLNAIKFAFTSSVLRAEKRQPPVIGWDSSDESVDRGAGARASRDYRVCPIGERIPRPQVSWIKVDAALAADQEGVGPLLHALGMLLLETGVERLVKVDEAVETFL